MKKPDRTLFTLTVVLTVLGLIAVADVSSPQALRTFSDSFYFVKQQLMWAVIGFVALVVATIIPYKFWRKIAYPFFGLSLLFLILVLIPGFGSRVLGARRWLLVGPFSFQPSEFVKLSLAILFARFASDELPPWYYFIILSAVFGLIMLQPDLGTTIIIAVIGMAQIFVAGINLLYLTGFGILGIGGGLLLVFFSDYRRERLMTFFQSSIDPLGSSYHIRQILISLGSGGLLGVGLGRSRQKHLFLPETATDSVFAIIAEEIGFIGSAFILLLLLFFVFKTLKIASKAPDVFSKVLGAGLSSWIGAQIFLNISSIVALTPLTGIPLPFFSYGGSSLTMTLVSVGILLNISKYGEEK